MIWIKIILLMIVCLVVSVLVVVWIILLSEVFVLLWKLSQILNIIDLLL
uniref:Uncharacterized protein ORF7 n=1 Tax=Spiroplasma virus 4 TaxID=2928746 RepID=ORF7_SPV4|nr:RecName: Full=Uncharacterized protein ORF7 [Spiroplasma phage 4]